MCIVVSQLYNTNKLLSPSKKVTEMIQTKVGNEMEVFITLTKYNACQNMVTTASSDHLVYFCYLSHV